MMVGATLIGTTYLAAVVASLFFPKPHQRERQADARKRGWSLPMIAVTRSTPFFTLYAQLWLVIALLTGHRECTSVAMILQTVVLVLYHVLAFLNPRHLTYEPEAFVQKIVGLIPPRDRHLLPWIGNRIQHHVSPLYLWVRGCKFLGGDGVVHQPQDVWLALLALGVYYAWGNICWHVQGYSTYPIQARLWEKGGYYRALAGCVLLTFGVGVGCDWLF